MKRILLAFRPLAIIIVVLWGIWFALSRIHASREDYRLFSEQRDDWIRRCEPLRDRPLSDPAERACNDELLRLTDLAKRKGWAK